MLQQTFPYTINDFVIHNSKVPAYQSHHRRNMIIHTQENCPVHFRTKNKENLLLPKVYESKKVQIYIETHHIIILLSVEDKTIDMVVWIKQ